MITFRAELTLTVDYTLNGTSPLELIDNLRNLGYLASGEGLFTRNSTAEVDRWSESVTYRLEGEEAA